MTDAVIYARVSSKEQSEGYSIDAQLRLLREYASKCDFDVVKEFLEVETARKSGRPVFRRMLKYLDSDLDRKIVLVEKTDRLYRNIKDWVTIDDLEIDIHFVKEGMIIGPAAKSSDKFFHGIRVLMAKNYCDNLSEEAKKGLTEKIKQGGWAHKAPFGYRNVKGEKSAEPVPEEAEVMTWMFNRMAEGDISVHELYREYKRMGFAAYIPLSKVYLKLRNPFYKGVMKWKGGLYQGNHEPIVDDFTWEVVQKILDIRGRPPKRADTSDFLYRGLLTCDHCGCAITAEKKKGRYIYYHCSEKRGPCKENGYIKEEVLTDLFAEYLASFRLPEDLFEELVRTIKEMHELKCREIDQEIKTLTDKASRIRNKRNAIYQDKLNGVITDKFWKEQHAHLNQQLGKVNKSLNHVDEADLEFFALAEQILTLAKDASDMFLKGNSMIKWEILNLVGWNFSLHSGTLINTTKKPFSLLKEGTLSPLVGEERFELSTSCSQSRRANRAAPLPDAHQVYTGTFAPTSLTHRVIYPASPQPSGHLSCKPCTSRPFTSSSWFPSGHPENLRAA